MKKCMYLIIALMLPLLVQGWAGSVIKMTKEALRKEVANWDQRDTFRRIDVLNEMAFRLRNNQQKRDSVRSWITEAYNFSKEIAYKKGQGDALVRFGLVADKSGETHEAIRYYKEALIIRLYDLKDTARAAGVCNNLGNLYKTQNDSLELAVHFYKMGLEILGPLSNKKDRGKLMNNLGGLLTSIGEYHEAGLYLDSSYLFRVELKDTLGMANTLLNKADRHQRLDNPTKAEEELIQALALFREKQNQTGIAKCFNHLGVNAYSVKDFPKAVSYYEQALANQEQLEYGDIGAIILNKGVAHLELQQYDQARMNYDLGRNLFDEANDQFRLAELEFNVGNLWYTQREYSLSIQYYRACLKHLKGLDNPRVKSKAFFKLSAAFTFLSKPDSALKYSSEYTEIRDSLYEEFQKTLTHEINFKEAQAKIYKLERDKEVYEHRRSRTIGFMGFGVMWVFLGIAIMGYYLSRQRRRLAEQREQISQQDVIELMREKQLETNYAWIDGIETARKKIGQELHDNIGSLLSMVKLYFSSVEEKIDVIQEENRIQYDKANQLLDEACQKVRSISHEMTSAILVNFGLKAQLEAMVETLQGTNQIEVELSVHGLSERLSNSLTFPIYSMIQEMVNNVIKHARASKLSIELNHFDDMINIMVADNGVGFNVSEVENKVGIGLKNLKSRIHQLEGQLNIDSRPNQGTSISIDIPINKDKMFTLNSQENETAD